MRCGIVRPNSAAAPATVSGELVPQCHWEKPGKAVTGCDPRARRPAVKSVARRAGCPGVGRYGAKAVAVARVDHDRCRTRIDWDRSSRSTAGDIGRHLE